MVSGVVVSLAVVSVVDIVPLVESTAVLSLPLAARSELQPIAVAATKANAQAKLKICFFIGFYCFVLI